MAASQSACDVLRVADGVLEERLQREARLEQGEAGARHLDLRLAEALLAVHDDGLDQSGGLRRAHQRLGHARLRGELRTRQRALADALRDRAASSSEDASSPAARAGAGSAPG